MMMFFGPAPGFLRGVRDEVDRIGTAAVFGQAVVVEIELAGDRIDHHIFQHRAEALGGGEDFRLGLGRQAIILA
jgi:hypothetical protein